MVTAPSPAYPSCSRTATLSPPRCASSIVSLIVTPHLDGLGKKRVRYGIAKAIFVRNRAASEVHCETSLAALASDVTDPQPRTEDVSSKAPQHSRGSRAWKLVHWELVPRVAR